MYAKGPRDAANTPATHAPSTRKRRSACGPLHTCTGPQGLGVKGVYGPLKYRASPVDTRLQCQQCKESHGVRRQNFTLS